MCLFNTRPPADSAVSVVQPVTVNLLPETEAETEIIHQSAGWEGSLIVSCTLPLMLFTETCIFYQWVPGAAALLFQCESKVHSATCYHMLLV